VPRSNRARRRWLAAVTVGAGIVLAPAAARAQAWGAKGGLNLSTITFEDLETTGTASAVAGGFIRLPLFAGLGIQAEGLFAQRRISFGDTVRHELNYLEVPLLARYRVATIAGGTVHVLGGGVLGVRLSADEVIGGQSVDIKEAYEPIDLGASIGGEVAIARRWIVDARYIWGLTNANDVPGFDIKFKTLQITVGYAF
jgi:hypothetical protein